MALQFNIQGLLNKQGELLKLINKIAGNKKIDVVMLQETWLTKTNCTLVNIPRYKHIFSHCISGDDFIKNPKHHDFPNDGNNSTTEKNRMSGPESDTPVQTTTNIDTEANVALVCDTSESSSESMSDNLLSPKQSALKPSTAANVTSSITSNSLDGVSGSNNSCIAHHVPLIDKHVCDTLGTNIVPIPVPNSIPGKNTINNDPVSEPDDSALGTNMTTLSVLHSVKGVNINNADPPSETYEISLNSKSQQSPDMVYPMQEPSAKDSSASVAPHDPCITDKYKDAVLSGTFECLQINEVSVHEVFKSIEQHYNHITSLASGNTQPLQQPKNDDNTLDHTYCATPDSSTVISNTKDSVLNDVITSIGDHHVISGLENLNITKNVTDEPIEVSMIIGDTLHEMQPDFLGINNLAPEIAVNDKNNVNLPDPLGINIDNQQLSSPDRSTVPDINIPDNPALTLKLNSPKGEASSAIILGINSTPSTERNVSISNQASNQSSSSSEFEGFHSDDLYTKAAYTSISSSNTLPTTTDFEYEDAAIDSSDTIPTTDNLNNSADFSHFYLTKNINEQYAPDVINLWKMDALSKKWTVPLLNLNKDDIYALSKPALNWEIIDPYSSLEEMETNSGKTPQRTVKQSSNHTP